MKPSTVSKKRKTTTRKSKHVRRYAQKGFSPLRRLKSYYYGRFPQNIPAQSFYPTKPPSRSPPKRKDKTFTKRFRSYFNWLLGKPSSSPLPQQPISMSPRLAQTGAIEPNIAVSGVSPGTAARALRRRKELIRELTQAPSPTRRSSSANRQMAAAEAAMIETAMAANSSPIRNIQPFAPNLSVRSSSPRRSSLLPVRRSSSINRELMTALPFRPSPIVEEQIAVLPVPARRSSSIRRQQAAALQASVSKKRRPRTQKKGIQGNKPLRPITFGTGVNLPTLNWNKIIMNRKK